MILTLTACAALFDNGVVDRTCEDLNLCDTAVMDSSSNEVDSGQEDTGDTGDTGSETETFSPNRYHARFFTRLNGGEVVSDPEWPTRLVFYAFAQSDGAEFQIENACVLSLSASNWGSVFILSGSFAGFQPTATDWTLSGRCQEMSSESLSELQDTFSRLIVQLAFAPLTPEVEAAAEILSETPPSDQLASFYLKIVDGPSDLLISPGAVVGWEADNNGVINSAAPLIFEGVSSAPDGFYETIPLTHHALP